MAFGQIQKGRANIHLVEKPNCKKAVEKLKQSSTMIRQEIKGKAYFIPTKNWPEMKSQLL